MVSKMQNYFYCARITIFIIYININIYVCIKNLLLIDILFPFFLFLVLIINRKNNFRCCKTATIIFDQSKKCCDVFEEHVLDKIFQFMIFKFNGFIALK